MSFTLMRGARAGIRWLRASTSSVSSSPEGRARRESRSPSSAFRTGSASAVPCVLFEGRRVLFRSGHEAASLALRPVSWGTPKFTLARILNSFFSCRPPLACRLMVCAGSRYRTMTAPGHFSRPGALQLQRLNIPTTPRDHSARGVWALAFASGRPGAPNGGYRRRIRAPMSHDGLDWSPGSARMSPQRNHDPVDHGRARDARRRKESL